MWAPPGRVLPSLRLKLLSASFAQEAPPHAPYVQLRTGGAPLPQASARDAPRASQLVQPLLVPQLLAAAHGLCAANGAKRQRFGAAERGAAAYHGSRSAAQVDGTSPCLPPGAAAVSYTHLTLPTNREV